MRFDRSIIAAPRAGLALLLAAAALLSGCSSNTIVQPLPKPLSRVALALHVDTLFVGGQRQFVATAYDTNGVATGGVTISWTSADLAVCTVSRTGLVAAVGEGTSPIIASASGKADTAYVYVRPAQTGWHAQTSGTVSRLNGVFFLADGHTGFAVGASGTMVTTTDAGTTWAPRASGAAQELTSVWFSDAVTGWAVGGSGTLVKTVTAGASWARQSNLPTLVNLECVRFVDADHGWIVGGNIGGFVARTRDGGATWTTQSFGGSILYGVSFADTLNGWAVGAGVVYGTHNGGDSWYLVQPSLTSQTLRGVARVSNTLAWAVGGLGTVAATAPTPDSLAWSSVASVGANYQLNAVQMVSDSTGWIAGSNLAVGAILTTTDGGVTWTPQAASSDLGLNGVYFTDRFRGWAVGAGGRIVHTSTAGAL